MEKTNAQIDKWVEYCLGSTGEIPEATVCEPKKKKPFRGNTHVTKGSTFKCMYGCRRLKIKIR
jgi:hypothetical protein